MTPDQKAKSIVSKFTEFHPVGYTEEMTPDIYTAKKHAVIAVDLVLEELESYSDLESVIVTEGHYCSVIEVMAYWKQVKQEVETL